MICYLTTLRYFYGCEVRVCLQPASLLQLFDSFLHGLDLWTPFVPICPL